jgi:LuxR family maltose regulon positive regulatory protein
MTTSGRRSGTMLTMREPQSGTGADATTARTLPPPAAGRNDHRPAVRLVHAAAPSRSLTTGTIVRRALFARLAAAAHVTQISAPPGSGKTLLLRSWIDDAGLADGAAWVTVEGREPERFWPSVLDALSATAVVQAPTAAPGLDGWAIVEHLLDDLGPLDGRVWLIIDDLHELHSSATLRQLELLILRAPAQLRFVLATRHEVPLGLHRLRLEGELTELRARDLRFSLDETRALIEAAGVPLSDSALGRLWERSEGWAAGLRLAALALVGHADPERFAVEFSGSERTVAEYLLAEVLDRQPPPVRRLLLRTSMLDRVNGPLADLLTGGSGAEGILQALEDANAFVVSLDGPRSWFRYHRLFSDLLAHELRRTAPAELQALHRTAARWYAEHGDPLAAISHAQAADDWPLAARLLSDHWFGFVVDGRSGAAYELLQRFPADLVATDAELMALMAAYEAHERSLETAERHLAQATRVAGSLASERSRRLQAILGIVRLSLARQRGDLPAAREEARRLLARADRADGPLPEEVRALALIGVGSAELASLRVEEAEARLERGIALARRLERPFLEVAGLAHSAQAAVLRSFAVGVERARHAIELALRHGWSGAPIVAPAYLALGLATVWQGRLEETASWLDRAERALRPEIEPVAGLMLHYLRGLLDLARGRDDEALATLSAGGRLAGQASHVPLVTRAEAFLLHAGMRLGHIDRVEQAVADRDEQERETTEMRCVVAALRLAQDDPHAATAVLRPVLDGSSMPIAAHWTIQPLLLEAIARDALGDAGATARALERALDVAERDGALLPFLLHPAPALLERHRRQRTAHAALLSEVLNLLGGKVAASRPPDGRPLRERLSESEIRVLRYLPTNLTMKEIAGELCVSMNTVKTHFRHLYAKLDVHRRGDAVERARGLGLLAPTPRLRPQ